MANLNKIDANTVDFYALRYANMWLGMRLDWMGTFLLAVLFFGVMILRNYFGDLIDASEGMIELNLYFRTSGLIFFVFVFSWRTNV